MTNVYTQILSKKESGKKQIALLMDPDHMLPESVISLCGDAQSAGVDYIFVGGSLLTNGISGQCVEIVKRTCDIPVVTFPGNSMQIDRNADAILFLSLISGRNADLLIGQHVAAAPIIKQFDLEAIPTGYMLIESGGMTTALYMSNSMPIPQNKAEIACCTALAGEMLGMKLIFMDAGSGANEPVPASMISAVSSTIDLPLIVGGGIRTPESATKALRAGADMIVIGNSIEQDPSLLASVTSAVHSVLPA
jgi:putative glycerol-1-phosphate prenyltransferase